MGTKGLSKDCRKIACDLLAHCYKHLRVAFLVCLGVKTRLRAKPFIRKCVPPTGSLSCQSNSFSFDRFCTRIRFETEARGNSKMAYSYLASYADILWARHARLRDEPKECLRRRLILTLCLSASLTIRILSPEVSMPARPALPTICLY